MTSLKTSIIAKAVENATHLRTRSARRCVHTGFSLVEVIIVLALIAVIAGFGMSFSMSSITRVGAGSERDLLVSLLTQARARAIANVDESAHGVSIDTSTHEYVTYAKAGGCTKPTTKSTRIPMMSSATFDVKLDRCFAQLSIQVPPDMVGDTTITLAGQEYTVNVNTVGRIDW